MPDNQTKNPFVIKCISEKCTVVHAGTKKYTADGLTDEINSGSEFGKKLNQVRDEVMEL